MREQGTHHAGRTKLDSMGKALPQDLTEHTARVGRKPREQPAALWVGDGPIGQSEPPGDDDTYLGNQGPKESLGEAAARGSWTVAATIPTASPHLEEPEAESQGKGWAKSRRPRRVVKRQAEDVPGDPGVSPRHFQPWPKHPLKHRVRNGPSKDSIQDGGGSPDWEAETFNPQGGLPVLYFSGRRERLLLRPEVLAEIPREAFTVEAWVRPEGGQNNPAIIAGKDPLLGFPMSWGVAGSISDGVRHREQGGEGHRAGKPGIRTGSWPGTRSEAGLYL